MPANAYTAEACLGPHTYGILQFPTVQSPHWPVVEEGRQDNFHRVAHNQDEGGVAVGHDQGAFAERLAARHAVSIAGTRREWTVLVLQPRQIVP